MKLLVFSYNSKIVMKLQRQGDFLQRHAESMKINFACDMEM
jgi:hypothetical protein